LGDEVTVSKNSQDLLPEDKLGFVRVDIGDGMPRATGEKGAASDDRMNVRVPVQGFAPDSVASRLNLGLIYERTGELEKSAALGGEGGYFELGEVYSRLGRWSEATAAFEKALEEDGTDSETLFNHGAAAMNAGDVAKASSSFEKLVENHPDHADGRYQLGMVYVNQAEKMIGTFM
jgi:tetratricopeptide (TPR) repeat protein